MKFNTFFKIYFNHRFEKAKFLLKLYILLILPFKYLYNLFHFPKKVDLDILEKNNFELKNKDLNKLFEYFNSDKGENFEDQYVQPSKRKKERIKGHGYAKFYENCFYSLKNKSNNILEIGSFHGNASAAIFFYFKNSKIYAGDIFPDLFRYKSKRIKNFYVDSSNENSIYSNIINQGINFDIIIEDASHMLKDQIISLFSMFRILKKEGLFIIEELDFPDTRDDMNKNKEKPTLKEILNCIINNKDFNSKYINEKDKEYLLKNILSIEIKKGNFNEFAIIKKK